MTDHQQGSTRTNHNLATQELEPKSDTPVAFALHMIKLHPGVNEDDFEKYMLEVLFPTVDTSPNGESDQHFLLNGGQRDEYVWMSRLAYDLHQTPLPNWLLNRVESQVDGVREKLESFGTHTASTTYYDVVGLRRRLGK